jgi:hypothetical protein
MNPVALRAGLVVVGVVMVLSGVVAGLGYAQLAIVNGGNGVAFSLTDANASLTATVVDQTTLGVGKVGTYNIQYTASVAWGDGVSSPLVKGGTYVHTYALHGTYRVSETWTVTYPCINGYFGSNTCTPGSLHAVTYAATGTIAVPAGTVSVPKPSSVTPNFAFAVNGLSVTATDQSTVVNANVTAIVFSFGSAGAVLSGRINGSTYYTYVQAGTYLVTETVTWNSIYAGSAPQTSVVSQNVTVGSSGAGTSSSTGGSSAAPAFLFNAVTAALLIGGAAFIAFSVLPQTGGKPEIALVLGIVFVVGGYFIGTVA